MNVCVVIVLDMARLLRHCGCYGIISMSVCTDSPFLTGGCLVVFFFFCILILRF
jgi:hypothetical protein